MYPTRDVTHDLIELNGRHPDTYRKYYLPFCEMNVSKYKTTDTWLVVQKVLKDKVAIQAALKEGGNEWEHVVVKIGEPEMIEKEYLRSRLLYANGLNGFVPYICLFKCFDDDGRYVKVDDSSLKNTGFCQGGNKMKSSIIMPYFGDNSLESIIKNNLLDFETIKMCIIGVIYNLREAYERVGFVHSDMHLENIFLKFEDNFYFPLIMDFGNSLVISPRFHQDRRAKIYYNVRHMADVIKILNELKDLYVLHPQKQINIVPILTKIQQSSNNVQLLDFTVLSTMIQNLEAETM